MTKKQEQAMDPGEMSYEAAVEELESIVEKIEGGEIGLEESMGLYERGTRLVRRCREILSVAEQKLTELDASMLSEGKE